MRYLLNHFRLITWFVSNCQSFSGRNDYVEEMQKTVDVDIYGKCFGKKLLEKESIEEVRTLSSYKFYLSFENSRCPEYATEKIYKVLNMKMLDNPPVPIVMGPNRTWYKNNLPQHSYIHVDDYKTPTELSNYLIYLNQEPDLYFEYLAWRRNHTKVEDSTLRCKMCNKLVEGGHIKENPHRIQNFELFWRKSDCNRY